MLHWASTTYTFSMYVDLENSGDITSNEVIAAISMTGDSGDDEVSFGEVNQNTGLWFTLPLLLLRLVILGLDLELLVIQVS